MYTRKPKKQRDKLIAYRANVSCYFMIFKYFKQLKLMERQKVSTPNTTFVKVRLFVHVSQITLIKKNIKSPFTIKSEFKIFL